MQEHWPVFVRRNADGTESDFDSADRADRTPCFGISVVSRILNMHPQTIRHYERLGLIRPFRTAGNIRMFSQRDVRRLQQIHTLTSMGVNLAGVEIIVRLLEQMEEMRSGLGKDVERLQQEVNRLRK